MSNKIESISKFIISRASKGMRTGFDDLQTADLDALGQISYDEFTQARGIAENTSFIPVDREASKHNPGLYRQAKEESAKTGMPIRFVEEAGV